MNASILERSFARMGARLNVRNGLPLRRRAVSNQVALDIGHDAEGELFDIAVQPGGSPEISVLDVQPTDRHLLLLIRQNEQKSKFLCGHDERHWFVAAIPESAPAGTVEQAKEALKPRWVQLEQNRRKLRGKARSQRKNEVYIRQGEWFFIPAKQFRVNEKLVLRNEPLSRGIGSKPHMAEFCFRDGGEQVMVTAKHPRGVSVDRYRRILAQNPAARSWSWQALRRNPLVFVWGRIRHADHKTIMLHDWHQVLMNTENQAVAMRSVAFLD